MRQTRCDGVIVGRGCLGRPWLFRDLADVFGGCEPADPPGLGEVLDTMLMHAARLADWFGEPTAMVAFRRHTSWYMKGFSLSSFVRDRMVQVKTVEELENLFRNVDREQAFPISAMRMKRGKRGGRQQVALPDGYLDDPDDQTPPAIEAEAIVSGG
jgi:tRNA-dihydrouridine synthase